MDSAAAQSTGGRRDNALLTPAEAKRVMMLISPLTAPVASVWTSHLYADHGKGGMGSARSSLDYGAGRSTRFTTTSTEDAMDSVLPSAPEAALKRLSKGRFANPSAFTWHMA